MGKRGKQGWKRVYLPVGTIKLRRRRRSSGTGFIDVRFIKVRDNLCSGLNWIPLAKHTWEQMHGPVPPGMRVVHVDGNTLNDNPANYGLMSPGQVIKMCHEQDPEMSRENRQGKKRREATAACNVDRGRVFRTLNWVQGRWYALNRTLGRILDRPLRSRRQVAALFGLQIAINGGVSRRRLAAVGVEFCRGRDIEELPRHWVKVSSPQELLTIELAAAGGPGPARREVHEFREFGNMGQSAQVQHHCTF